MLLFLHTTRRSPILAKTTSFASRFWCAFQTRSSRVSKLVSLFKTGLNLYWMHRGFLVCKTKTEGTSSFRKHTALLLHTNRRRLTLARITTFASAAAFSASAFPASKSGMARTSLQLRRSPGRVLNSPGAYGLPVSYGDNYSTPPDLVNMRRQ